MNTCLLCTNTSFTPIKSTFGGKHIGRCEQCGLVQVYPRVTVKEYAQLYADDWDHFGPYVSQIPAHRAYFAKVLTFLKRYISIKHAKLLDVGCALGVLLEEAKNMGMRAEGIDISSAAVLYGKKRGLAVYNETCASFYTKRHIKNRYAVVTALEVIEHEKNPMEMMRIIHKMLRPDGVVVVTTPNFNTIFRIIMGNAWIGYQHKEHLWFFTPRTIHRLLKETGFTDIRIQKDFLRSYSVSYALGRLGDYFPILRPVMTSVASLFGTISLPVLFNPWGDMLVVARK